MPTASGTATATSSRTATSTATPTATSTAAPPQTASATPTATTSPQIGGSQPYSDVTTHPSEYVESKGALGWIGEIKLVVDEALRAGLIRADEVPLWRNVLLGMVGVESVGRNFSLAAANSNWYSQGLTQLVYAHLYAEEDPYDPLTNLRTGMRTVLRYYRMHGNRWDWAVAQHVTGASNELTARDSRDWNGTSGLDYAKRVVNMVWWANSLFNSGDVYPARYYAYQASGNGGFDKAPLWDIFDSPGLAYAWNAPSTSSAGYYQTLGADNNIRLPINYNTWMIVPDWFYSANPAASVLIYQPRPASDAELAGYPVGHTLNAPHQETYPRQQWAAPDS